jgi:transposase
MLAADPSVDLWALDEVHFHQHGSRCRMWVPPEIKDPVCIHAPTRKSISYFGAVRLRDGKLCTLPPSGYFDAQTCWRFFRHLRGVSARSGRRVVVIIDNARYHHAVLHAAWRKAHEPDFTLLFLPAYSPQLNPIERVWKLLRRLWIHNRYFSSIDELAILVNAQFRIWTRPNPVLRRLCAVGKHAQ